jgi:hypothetical protein
VASKNIRKGLSKPRKGEIVATADNTEPQYIRTDEATEAEQVQNGQEVRYIAVEQKIEVEIRDLIRIKPSDFSALKDSFEEWASKWN